MNLRLPGSAATRRTFLLTTAAALAVVASLTLPVPYVIVSPGPTFNTLGEYAGEPIVEITGATTYPTDGALDITTVRERGGPYGPLTVVEAVVAALGSASVVVPGELLFPPGVTSEQQREASRAEFTAAQTNAVAAALNSLDIPVTEQPIVASVDPDGPARDVLRAGDLLVSVGGQPATSTQAVVQQVRGTAPGTVVPVVVDREGQQQQLEVTLTSAADNPDQGRVGVVLRSVYSGPFEVDFSLSGIGGPSAGLVFALAIVDELTPGELTGGRSVAGTGTISPTGEVGAIGGIAQKMVGAKRAGAELFLAPRDNCDAVLGSVPEGLVVAAVDTLSEAEEAIAVYLAGETPAGCEVAVTEPPAEAAPLD